MSSLILVEGMDIDFLHKCALEDCTEQHQFSSVPNIIKVWLGSLTAIIYFQTLIIVINARGISGKLL